MITKFTDVAKKLPSPVYKALAQSYIDYDFPRHIFIETTANCNLSCSYCPREKIKEDMDYGLFKRIVDECNEYGPRSFSLHLFGEPLLYKHILESVRYIKAKDKRHTVLLTTNGTLLNQFADKLVGVGVDRIIWSWRRNNFTPDTVAILRKIGTIRLLIEETPKEEFEKWKTFPRVEIKHLHNYGGNIELARWGLSDSVKPSRWPCYHLWLAPAVRYNGDITICCDDPHGVEVVGNYRDISLAEFWRSEKLESIRRSHLEGRHVGLCKNCNVWKTYPNMFFGWQYETSNE